MGLIQSIKAPKHLDCLVDPVRLRGRLGRGAEREPRRVQHLPVELHRDPLLPLASDLILAGEFIDYERTQGFAVESVYGRAKCLPMLGEIKT